MYLPKKHSMYLPKGQYLTPEQCEPGYLYQIIARNSKYGIWIPIYEDDTGFWGGHFLLSRNKFEKTFIDNEKHYDLHHQGTAQPLVKMREGPYDMEFYKKFPIWEGCNFNDVDNLLHWLGIEWIDPLKDLETR